MVELAGNAPGRTVGGAMKAKNQRLVLALGAVTLLVAAGLLAMVALRTQASYYVTASVLLQQPPATDDAVRLGGMVKTGSVARSLDGLTTRFLVGDGRRCVPVVFSGILPDLFREGSGVTADGRFVVGVFQATGLLAKHDENYVPPAMAKRMTRAASARAC